MQNGIVQNDVLNEIKNQEPQDLPAQNVNDHAWYTNLKSLWKAYKLAFAWWVAKSVPVENFCNDPEATKRIKIRKSKHD